jgi:hypothetical protein
VVGVPAEVAPAQVAPAAPVTNGAWGAAVGIGAGFLAAFALLDGRLPAWPPAESRHFLYYLAVLVTVLAVLDAVVRWPNWLRQEAALVTSACAVGFLFRSLLRGETWPAWESAWRVVVMTVILHAAWTSSELLVSRLPRLAGPLVLFVFAAGAGGVIMFSGSLVYGRLAGAIAAATLAGVLVAFMTRDFSLARGGVTVTVPVVVALLFLGHHYVDPGLTPANGVLLLSALALPWLAELPIVAKRPAWVRTWVALILAAAPVTAAGWRARQVFLQMETQTGEESQPEGDAGWYTG